MADWPRMKRAWIGAALAAVGLLLSGCAGAGGAGAAPEAPGVYALVLGTAQDAGIPQLGCFQPCCADARAAPELRRLPSSVLIVDARTSRRWLLDCAPSLEEQVADARERGALGVSAGSGDGGAGRPPLFDGIFPTHAHLGHYAGLLQLGREAYGVTGQAVWATERMERFRRGNDPWAYLVESGGLVLERLVPGVPVALADDLSLEALAVPHSDELSDTVGFLVRGPTRTLLYLPDIDKWERWNRRLEEVVRGVDVALIDGTFFADGEIPGRSMRDIPHPFVTESLARLASLSPDERARVWFTHLNHTNPVARADSAEARAVRAAGLGVAREGMVFGL
jgi:pyrroloquinoline quinone biosynthesis protein B